MRTGELPRIAAIEFRDNFRAQALKAKNIRQDALVEKTSLASIASDDHKYPLIDIVQMFFRPQPVVVAVTPSVTSPKQKMSN